VLCYTCFLQFFPLTGLWGELGYEPKTFSCTILKKDGRSPKTFIFLVGFLLPCFIIILSYSCIFNTVRKQHAKLNKFDTTSPTKSKLKFFRNKNDLRLTIMMLVIFLCFIVCFLPLMLVNVFDEKTMRYPAAHVMASVSAWSSAVINPIIYAVGSSQYRNAYKNLFVAVKAWRSSNSSGNNNNNKIHVSRSVDPNSVHNVHVHSIKIPGEGIKASSSCLEVT
jgi:Na+(H+)/acetate symporter ActP